VDVKSSAFSSQGDSPACGEQLLKDLFFNNPSVMFILQPESGAILEANDAALSFYGYPRKHLQSLKITDLDASLAVQVPSIEEQQKGTMGVFQRTRHRLASGKNREVEIQKAPLDWKGLKALYAVVRDISEIIFVQEKFDAKSAFLEQLFQNSPIPIQQCSMDGRIISANTATEHLFGYSKEEMVGQLVDDLFATPETRTEAEANTRAVVEGNTIFFEGERYRKNGERLFVSGTAFPIVMNGKQIGTYSLYMDLTALKKAEENLKKNREQYRSLVEDIPAMFCSFDSRGFLSFANREFCSFFRQSPAKLSGSNILNFIPKDNHTQITRLFRTLLTGLPSVTAEIPVNAPDGSLRWHRWTVRRLATGADERKEFRAAGQDITDSKLVQTALEENIENMERVFNETVEVLASVTEAKDPYIHGHQRRVAELAGAIAAEMGYGKSFVRRVRQAALVHEIGNLVVPGEILNKPGKLSHLEFELVKGHCEAGEQILMKINLSWPLHTIVRQHHERMDGSGYPDGIRDGEILPEARIIAVADMVEAMTSHRPYRPAFTINSVLGEINRLGGSSLDKNAVNACRSLFLEKNFTYIQ